MLLNICLIMLIGSPCIVKGFAKWYCAIGIMPAFCFGVPETKVVKEKIFVPLLKKEKSTIQPVIGCMAEMLFHKNAKRLLGRVMQHRLNLKNKWEWFPKVSIHDHRLWTNTFR